MGSAAAVLPATECTVDREKTGRAKREKHYPGHDLHPSPFCSPSLDRSTAALVMPAVPAGCTRG
jgi:hypothetical protein